MFISFFLFYCFICYLVEVLGFPGLKSIISVVGFFNTEFFNSEFLSSSHGIWICARLLMAIDWRNVGILLRYASAKPWGDYCVTGVWLRSIMISREFLLIFPVRRSKNPHKTEWIINYQRLYFFLKNNYH